MIATLGLQNVTVFASAELEFAPGLNLIVGDNGTGKTHILKMAYSVLYVCHRGGRDTGTAAPDRAYLQAAVTKKLMGVFKPDGLGRLVGRTGRGRRQSRVSRLVRPSARPLGFAFHSASREVKVEAVPTAWVEKPPVYLPTRELLSIYPGFVSLYETTHLSFDETWRDTCLLLGAPLVRGRREAVVREVLNPLETAMDGNVDLTDAGGFYLNKDGVAMEMHLVAEGLRKLAMLARLIATGALLDKGYLFWDEPEANLNPKVQKLIARTVLHLCRMGIQAFIATHSLFLLRELDILLRSPEFRGLPARFFGLEAADEGVRVRQGGTVDDIGTIDALQEELTQSDRYLAAGAE